MPFLAAGDPDIATTGRLIQILAESGADLIEVGFPYSDPIADGPVIQSSYTRALNNNLKLKDIFRGVSEVREKVSCPLVAMVSYSIIFRTGTDSFVRQAHDAGFCGLIVPDLRPPNSRRWLPLRGSTSFSLSLQQHPLIAQPEFYKMLPDLFTALP